MDVTGCRRSVEKLPGTVPGTVLRAFFAEFHLAGLEYCVMRNFSQLPQTVGTSDLDILIRPSQQRLAEGTIGRVLGRLGGRVVARVPARGSYLKTMGHTDGCWWGLAIDLVADVDFRGLVYITADDVLGRSRLHNGVRVASEADAAVGALAKEMINNLEAEAKYIRDARAAWQQDADASMTSLVAFGPGIRADIGEFLMEESADEKLTLRSLGLRMRRELVVHQGMLRRCNAMYQEVIRRFSRVCRRPGVLVAVACTNPVVSAELIDAMLPVLKRAFHNRVLLGDGSLRDGSGELLLEGQRIARSAASPASVRRLGFAKLLWGHFFSYFLRIYPRMVGKPHLVCINRYYGAVEQEIKGRVVVCRLLRALIPKPDFVLLVRADPLGDTASCLRNTGVGSEDWYCSASRCLELDSASASGNADKALGWLMEQLARRTGV